MSTNAASLPLVSSRVALVMLLHLKVNREGGDMRPVMALYGEPRYAAHLAQGQEMLAAYAKELAGEGTA